MHIALAVQPGRGDTALWPVLLGIFAEPETEPGVEVDGVLHFGGKYIKVVEPLRMATLVEVVAA